MSSVWLYVILIAMIIGMLAKIFWLGVAIGLIWLACKIFTKSDIYNKYK